MTYQFLWGAIVDGFFKPQEIKKMHQHQNQNKLETLSNGMK